MVSIAVASVPAASGNTVAQESATPHASAVAAQPATQPGRLDVQAHHLGNLQLHITADLADRSLQGVQDAQVVAYTDMVAMPGAHLNGPHPMEKIPGLPGQYALTMAVPMVGAYEIRVEVLSPLHMSGRTITFVGTVSRDLGVR